MHVDCKKQGRDKNAVLFQGILHLPLFHDAICERDRHFLIPDDLMIYYEKIFTNERKCVVTDYVPLYF